MKGPTSIYLRLIDYNSRALTGNGTFDDNIVVVKDTLDTANGQFLKVINYSCDVEQAINIGSQSSGAGAGKIIFNPFKIAKFADAITPSLFVDAASGKAFRTAEVFFLDAKDVVLFMYTYKLVAVKTIAWSAVSGEPRMMETVTFEYGGLVITVIQKSKTNKILQGGWNRVKNINDSDLNTVIA